MARLAGVGANVFGIVDRRRRGLCFGCAARRATGFKVLFSSRLLGLTHKGGDEQAQEGELNEK